MATSTRKTFAEYLNEDNCFTRTENNAFAFNTTGSSLLDLFGLIGALRTRPQDVVGLFEKAFAEDSLLATKMSFYARNVLGGLGERAVSRVMWRWLANEHPEIMKKNLELVPQFGRWDDLYSFVGTSIENTMWDFMFKQFANDYADAFDKKPVSLLAKWLKSPNTSSQISCTLGKLTAKKFNLSEKNYRKSLSFLRAYIDVTETKMSANKWGDIKYSGVPSKAMANYHKAFERHDEDAFEAYIESVRKGKNKIHSGTLFPYEIFEKMELAENYHYSQNTFSFSAWDEVLEEQWKALPNYVGDKNANVLVVADTSGSMRGRPICSSIGLAVYFAERNHGEFHNKFITFSSIPKFVTICGATLKEKIMCIPAIVENTNLEAVFELILNTAVANNVPAEDLPKAIVIISDMEIDNAGEVTFHKSTQNNFAAKGYELPSVIYWNVDARQNVFHGNKNENGIQVVSGQSPSIFKSVLKSIGKDAYTMMLETLNDSQYNCVKI
jgi:hypothetical protein